MKKILFTIASTFSVLLIGCSGENKPVANQEASALVTVAYPTYHNEANFQSSGTVKAKQSANISTRMMGTVQNILVTSGDLVKKGDLLLQIDNADIQAQRNQANAGVFQANTAFKMAEKNYQRFTTLLQQNSISQKEFDDVETGYKMAKAQLEMARQAERQALAQLKYANIRAPFNGQITNRFINTGAIARPGMPLVHIENTLDFEILTNVPEAIISKINQGDQVGIRIKSNQEILTGVVSEISRSAIETGGQFSVRIAVDATDTHLYSGMFTSVVFPIATGNMVSQTPTLVIPKRALVKKGQLSGIYTVGRNNVAQLRWLKLGKSFGTQIEVLSGLKKEEQFIVSTSSKLYNGIQIQIQ